MIMTLEVVQINPPSGARHYFIVADSAGRKARDQRGNVKRFLTPNRAEWLAGRLNNGETVHNVEIA
jgi:hypothetical protein